MMHYDAASTVEDDMKLQCYNHLANFLIELCFGWLCGIDWSWSYGELSLPGGAVRLISPCGTGGGAGTIY